MPPLLKNFQKIKIKFLSKLTLIKGVRETMVVILITTAINFTSCNKDGSLSWSFEKEDNNYQRAARLYREEKYEEALNLFLKVIDNHREAPESHLEVGRIYLDHLKDPLTAIYHFRKYLEYKPNAEQFPIVKQMIERSKKEFARSLPGSQPCESSLITSTELSSIIQNLKNENRFLKNQLENIKKLNTLDLINKKHTEQIAKKSENSLSPINQQITLPNSQSTYTVLAGDTLSSISKKIYGKTTQWEKIYNLNKEQLPSPSSLKIGQVLKLPAPKPGLSQ